MNLEITGYDPQRALRYARMISTPRLVGTEQEKAVGKQIAARLESYGFQVERQVFHFSNALNVFVTLEILLSQVLILLTLWLQSIDSPARTVSALVLIVLLALTGAIHHSVQENSLEVGSEKAASSWSALMRRIGRRYSTANYFARLPEAPSQAGGTKLLLVAHYDSKSQRMPLVLRIILFIIGIGGSLLFAILVLLSSLHPPLVMVASVVGIFSILAAIPLLLLDQGNVSPGAVDDASGVGVVLHLVEVLARQPEICHRIGLSVLITSAEEFGALGSTAFALQHAKQLQQQANSGRLYILNFDGPGVDGELYWVGKEHTRESTQEPSLASLARQACKELGYPLRRFSLPGALFDHLPFTERGFDSGSLIAIGRVSRLVHTSSDSVDQLHVRGFEQAGWVALRIIEHVMTLPETEQAIPDCGVEKSDIYKVDPILSFFRDQLHLTPNRMLLIALALGIVDLLIAKSYNLWYSRNGIIGAFQDPPYLLTIFVIIPLFLRSYIWLPDGMWGIFQGMLVNHLVRESDLTTYKNNVQALIRLYNPTWFVVTVIIASFIQILVVVGNSLYPDTYNTILSARLIFFRIPYGLLAIFGATSVVVRAILNGDWSQLTKDIEPQIHPMHPDMSAGYGSFTHYIINMLGIFVGIATFFFTKALFQPSENQVTFKPVYDFWIIASTILYFIVGFLLFLYIPTGAARRAIRQAKRKQIGVIAERYKAEQQIFLGMARQGQAGTGEAPSAISLRTQVERLKLLNEAIALVENVPSSPINRKTIQRFGLSYISIYLSTMVYNFLRAYMTETTAQQFKLLLEQGSLSEILRGILSIFLTGHL